MRTTVTIDPDVEALLRSAMKRTGISFKEALNDGLRRGLVGQASQRDRPKVRLRSFPMRLRAGINLDKALLLASELEDEELTRRMQVGK